MTCSRTVRFPRGSSGLNDPILAEVPALRITAAMLGEGMATVEIQNPELRIQGPE
jgi:hypothetical protein